MAVDADMEVGMKMGAIKSMPCIQQDLKTLEDREVGLLMTLRSTTCHGMNLAMEQASSSGGSP